MEKWKEYEKVVHEVYQTLLNIEGKDITLHHDVKIPSKYGDMRQVDIYYGYKVGDIEFKVIIECKDHRRKNDIIMVESFKAKLDAIGSCTGIIVSSSGFTQSAKRYCNENGIITVTSNENTLRRQLLARLVDVMLPDENVVGEPFWTFMEERDGKVTGKYNCCKTEETLLGLFFARKHAEEYKELFGGVVRGVSRTHLAGSIELSRQGLFTLGVCNFDDEKRLYVLPIDRFEKYFLE